MKEKVRFLGLDVHTETLMNQCFLGSDQFAAGVNVPGTKRDPRTLFTSRFSERQES
jgi:hypothetical protein